jgi:hypothetical protein
MTETQLWVLLSIKNTTFHNHRTTEDLQKAETWLLEHDLIESENFDGNYQITQHGQNTLNDILEGFNDSGKALE